MLDDPASKLTALGCSSGGASAGAGAGAPSSLTTTCTDGPANKFLPLGLPRTTVCVQDNDDKGAAAIEVADMGAAVLEVAAGHGIQE